MSALSLLNCVIWSIVQINQMPKQTLNDFQVHELAWGCESRQIKIKKTNGS